ncbi:AAA-type ATPase family protein [Klebsormidium nitens]|uniref:microtubule-severing ATPase n=1 Tax=Klebsormidium nitens TaxID=105231 RepID=A0A1Y1IRB9_KLENI|nr:AAA-type ATPase family protein [Klebsormidium nitens]|eukprot:GAQ92592.1 AAA-type ATPase family protein [Klebsormidium nitens]
MQARDDTTFKDIGGMKQVKIALTEMVILPSVRSDIYTGLRTPPRGLLLFGPPGNGKTYIARAVANEVKATFFSISATSFASSLVGDAENLLRALFTVARKKQPSLILIDEIDSILTKRCENDQEYTRKLKTEFFVQFDGVATDKSDRVTVIAATNLPQELDDAAVRRFEKRIYVGLPDLSTRRQLLEKHLQPNIPNPRSQKNRAELLIAKEIARKQEAARQRERNEAARRMTERLHQAAEARRRRAAEEARAQAEAERRRAEEEYAESVRQRAEEFARAYAENAERRRRAEEAARAQAEADRPVLTA